MAIMALCGCGKEENGGNGAKAAGTAVDFALSQSAHTRTVYDETDKYQIDWTQGDKVKIFCAEAEDVKSATYDVIPSATDKHSGKLTYNANGLKWGGDSNIHNFYAVYPADDSKVTFSDGIAHFKINHSQLCQMTQDASTGNWVGAPDMSWAYMVSSMSTKPVDQVSMTFSPVMTTLNITIRGHQAANDADVTITGVSIVNENVHSSDVDWFQYDLRQGAMVNESTSATSVETTLIKLKNGNDNFIDLKAGHTLTLTAFLPPIPINAQNQIKVRVHATGETTQEITLGGTTDKNGQTMNFNPSCKGSLSFGWFSTTKNGNNWITPLDDNIYVSQLSIPGAHDSCSKGADASAGRTQELSIDDQLLMGIRAFDLRPTTPNIGGEDSGHNAQLPIYHGVTFCNIRLDEVFAKFNAFLTQNPGEFIIGIVRWESEGDAHWGLWSHSGEKNPKTFNASMRNFINNSSYFPQNRKADFKKDITVGEMRGKILLIVRPNIYTDAGYYADNAYLGTTFISDWHSGSESVEQGVYFHNVSGSNAPVIGNAVVQDYYHDQDHDKKIRLIKEELQLSAQSHTNPNYKFTWFINHCSGYEGVTALETNAYPKNARDINLPIYNYIAGQEKTVGSTGIMLLDFVGARESHGLTVYGDLLPQTIINNNYKYRMNRRGE